jgi:DNA-damage-inducible protein J
MPKTGYVAARVEPALKKSAQNVLRRVGLSTTEAITLFLRQVVLQRGLPFEARIPNRLTRAAIEELESGAGESFAGTNAEFFASLGRKRKTKRKI